MSLSLKPGAKGDRGLWRVCAVDPGRKEYAVFQGRVVVAGRVYIAATRFVGDKVVTAIHCYPSHPQDTTAPLLWKTDVCETENCCPCGDSANPPAADPAPPADRDRVGGGLLLAQRRRGVARPPHRAGASGAGAYPGRPPRAGGRAEAARPRAGGLRRRQALRRAVRLGPPVLPRPVQRRDGLAAATAWTWCTYSASARGG